ncbi:hypothetical protein Nm8I071_64760 [Nonomuraea sp. TT08I-71]|nr:hypothetical protein Nm8I071_64760 [Nonomuraea sp. TT08I-71]
MGVSSAHRKQNSTPGETTAANGAGGTGGAATGAGESGLFDERPPCPPTRNAGHSVTGG